MRYFLFASILILISCGQPFKDLRVQNEGQWKEFPGLPSFDHALYRCHVEGRFGFKKFYLSGLLFFKKLEDSSNRVIFQNEMGITYFDFSWDRNEQFEVHYIFQLMDKPALILTLRKDIEMLLGINFLKSSEKQFYKDKEHIFRYDLEKGYVYYYFNEQGDLHKIEHGDHKQKVVNMKVSLNKNDILADNIFIDHLKAGFTITLKQLNK